jgi:hypothetical protein
VNGFLDNQGRLINRFRGGFRDGFRDGFMGRFEFGGGGGLW